jgi:hypothetical protein
MSEKAPATAHAITDKRIQPSVAMKAMNGAPKSISPPTGPVLRLLAQKTNNSDATQYPATRKNGSLHQIQIAAQINDGRAKDA